MPYLFPTGAAARDALDVLGAFPVTFEAVTPALISGNLLTLVQQRAQEGTAHQADLTFNATGGPDGGGFATGVVTTASAAAEFWRPVTLGAVTAGQAYTATFRLMSPAGAAVRPVHRWFTAGSVFISNTVGSGVTLAPGVWTTVTVTATAPATAAFCGPFVLAPAVGSLLGDTVNVSVVCLRTSATIPASFGAQCRYKGAAVSFNLTGFTGCASVDASNRLVMVSAGATGGQGFYTTAADIADIPLDTPIRFSASFVTPVSRTVSLEFGNTHLWRTSVVSIASTTIWSSGIVYAGRRFAANLSLGVIVPSAAAPNGEVLTLQPMMLEVTP